MKTFSEEKQKKTIYFLAYTRKLKNCKLTVYLFKDRIKYFYIFRQAWLSISKLTIQCSLCCNSFSKTRGKV